MRNPSARVLINRVDVYPGTLVVDAAGGSSWAYPSTPTYSQKPCTAQAVGIREVVDDQDRITQLVEWKIMFGSFVSVDVRDRLNFEQPAGVSHEAFVEVSRDEAGRGAAFTVRATERI